MRSLLSHLHSYSVKDSLDAEARVAQAKGIEVVDADGGYRPDFVSEVVRRDEELVARVLNAFHHGSFGDEKVSVRDMITSKDFSQIFYAAVEVFLAQAIMPANVVTGNLFTTVPFTRQGAQFIFRTFGPSNVEEVPEGAEFPNASPSMNDQAYRLAVEIKKYGAKIPITAEMMEEDSWGLVAFLLKNLAVALANKKEYLAVNLLNENSGWVLADNHEPANSQLGSLTGRGIDGKFNGTLTIEDLLAALTWMNTRGYNADTLLIHPFAWIMLTRDKELSDLAFRNITYVPATAPGWGDVFGQFGPTLSKFGSSVPTGATDGVANPVDSVFGKLGIGYYSYPNLTPFGATYTATNAVTGAAVKVITSPLVPFFKVSSGTASQGVTPANGKYATNIILADSQKCGLILQKENPVMERWNDPDREVNYMKVRERYGMALQEMGRGVGVIKYAVVDKNYSFINTNSVSLSSPSADYKFL